MKKIIIPVLLLLVICVGVAAFITITRAGADDTNVIIDELLVGRYYRSGGTADEYIEVYDDGTMCMYGYESVTEIFNKRCYYVLSDVLPFVGLSEEPVEEGATPAGMIGYSYDGPYVLEFSTTDGEVLYIYEGAQ